MSFWTVKISFLGEIAHSNEINMNNYLKYNSLEVIKILPLIRNLFKMNRFPRKKLGTVEGEERAGEREEIESLSIFLKQYVDLSVNPTILII